MSVKLDQVKPTVLQPGAAPTPPPKPAELSSASASDAVEPTWSEAKVKRLLVMSFSELAEEFKEPALRIRPLELELLAPFLTALANRKLPALTAEAADAATDQQLAAAVGIILLWMVFRRVRVVRARRRPEGAERAQRGAHRDAARTAVQPQSSAEPAMGTVVQFESLGRDDPRPAASMATAGEGEARSGRGAFGRPPQLLGGTVGDGTTLAG